MLHKLRERAQSEKGFTLIELLVVILIIGILAAIALPAFLNQREKAQDTEAKSNVRTAQTAMETYYTDNQAYTTDKTKLEEIEPAIKQFSSRMALTAGTGTGGYKIEVTSQGKNNNKFSYDANATNPRSCTTANKGGCPSNGSW